MPPKKGDSSKVDARGAPATRTRSRDVSRASQERGDRESSQARQQSQQPPSQQRSHSLVTPLNPGSFGPPPNPGGGQASGSNLPPPPPVRTRAEALAAARAMVRYEPLQGTPAHEAWCTELYAFMEFASRRREEPHGVSGSRSGTSQRRDLTQNPAPGPGGQPRVPPQQDPPAGGNHGAGGAGGSVGSSTTVLTEDARCVLNGRRREDLRERLARRRQRELRRQQERERQPQQGPGCNQVEGQNGAPLGGDDGCLAFTRELRRVTWPRKF